MLGRCLGDARAMLGQCLGDAWAMLGRCSGDARAMLGRCSSDALIGTIGTIWSLLRAKSALFESLGRLRSREYLEPCLHLRFDLKFFLKLKTNKARDTLET